MIDSRQVSIEHAEELAEKRLDRRRNYAVIEGQLCSLVRWTDACSGCFEFGEYGGLAHLYGYDKKRGCHVGAGCDECGYTGRPQNGFKNRGRERIWLSPHCLEVERQPSLFGESVQ